MTDTPSPVFVPLPMSFVVPDDVHAAAVAALADRCTTCLRPRATQQDWDQIPEGEGGHLCWDEPGSCTFTIATVDRETVTLAAALPVYDAHLRATLAAQLRTAADEQETRSTEDSVTSWGVRAAIAEGIRRAATLIENRGSSV